jgi:uncharacterized membrane protein YhiD involved in acid resistance
MHLARILLSVFAAAGLTVLVGLWLAPSLGEPGDAPIAALAGVVALVAALGVGLAARRGRRSPR